MFRRGVHSWGETKLLQQGESERWLGHLEANETNGRERTPEKVEVRRERKAGGEEDGSRRAGRPAPPPREERRQGHTGSSRVLSGTSRNALIYFVVSMSSTRLRDFSPAFA